MFKTISWQAMVFVKPYMLDPNLNFKMPFHLANLHYVCPAFLLGFFTFFSPGNGAVKSDDQKLRLQAARSLRLIICRSQLNRSAKRVDLILNRIENFDFPQNDQVQINEKLTSIRRYMSSFEYGLAKHELGSLAAMLTMKQR